MQNTCAVRGRGQCSSIVVTNINHVLINLRPSSTPISCGCLKLNPIYFLHCTPKNCQGLYVSNNTNPNQSEHRLSYGDWAQSNMNPMFGIFIHSPWCEIAAFLFPTLHRICQSVADSMTSTAFFIRDTRFHFLFGSFR